MRDVLRLALEGAGYSVIEAQNGREGVEKVVHERPDLVIMDIQMPVLDGYDATREIKSSPDISRTPIIALSSFAMKGDEEKARAAGCDDYVTKPFSPKQMVALVRNYIGESG